MAIRPPFDVGSRVSTELSALIEQLVDDPEREEPPTLDEVRAALARARPGEAAFEALHPQEHDTLIAELDDLIEEFGGDLLAADFVAAKASEVLSRVIEAVMDDPSRSGEPTLGAVRQAMAAGLTARMIGDGVFDSDEDATLRAEIDELIERFGDGALAEEFIRLD